MLNVHQNSLQDLVKYRLLSPGSAWGFWFGFSVGAEGLKICISDKLSSGGVAALLWNKFKV